MTKNINKYYYSVGRRKSAVSAVKLFIGKNDSKINQKPSDKYFPDKSLQTIFNKPFQVTNTVGKYYFEAKITGGGKLGQAGALSLALSRSLQKIDRQLYTPLLRASSLLTVDSRVRQRRMIGTGGKSRRQKQSPRR